MALQCFPTSWKISQTLIPQSSKVVQDFTCRYKMEIQTSLLFRKYSGSIVSSKKTRTSTREHHLIRLRRRGHRPTVGHAAREKQGGKKEAREKERFVWGLLNFQESMHLQWLHPSSQITVPRLD